MNSPLLFIADLHLSAHSPAITRRFLDFLEGEARAAAGLYILGDLFEAWPGDDTIDADPCHHEVVSALRAFSEHGGRLAIMPGNRDFLLGPEFARRSGATLLADPSVLVTDGGTLILSHGDALCTADADYQAFRRQVRDPAWQAAFLARPLAERQAIAEGLRRQSENVKRDKTLQLMDVTGDAADSLLRERGAADRHGAVTLIHGHTHRPARHEHVIDGQKAERWVAADWSDSTGEYLSWDGKALTRHRLD
ncbi:UDP-2,3-diacylglucosamine diphosphatase [Rhodocyclus purpureus]|uniref:UDP-2,3-diacylglucosamine diphosphatase n=1 Tax=Rhodocyclus purpureus TaxID=1067 RepID=UPI001912284B|nr:UDP-2,3-diacylglucosamine diphosphatase [Rhodocyclus purpureus]MBK5913417.1 UDP-2,3-diacylglucosamine diphosphatase [Rhodocyclus purpureus]